MWISARLANRRIGSLDFSCKNFLFKIHNKLSSHHHEHLSFRYYEHKSITVLSGLVFLFHLIYLPNFWDWTWLFLFILRYVNCWVIVFHDFINTLLDTSFQDLGNKYIMFLILRFSALVSKLTRAFIFGSKHLILILAQIYVSVASALSMTIAAI